MALVPPRGGLPLPDVRRPRPRREPARGRCRSAPASSARDALAAFGALLDQPEVTVGGDPRATRWAAIGRDPGRGGRPARRRPSSRRPRRPTLPADPPDVPARPPADPGPDRLPAGVAHDARVPATARSRRRGHERVGGARPLPRAGPPRPRRRGRGRPAPAISSAWPRRPGRAATTATRRSRRSSSTAASTPGSTRSRPTGGRWRGVPGRRPRWSARARRGRRRSPRRRPPSASPTPRPGSPRSRTSTAGARTLAQVAPARRDPPACRSPSGEAVAGVPDERPTSPTRLGGDRTQARNPPRSRTGPLEPAHLERILNAGPARRRAPRTCSAGRSSSAATAPTCGSSSHVGPWAGHLAGAAVGIALVTPDPRARPARRCRSCSTSAGRPQNMLLAAWELGHRQRARRRSTSMTWRAGSLGYPGRPRTASTCCRSAIRPIRPS